MSTPGRPMPGPPMAFAHEEERSTSPSRHRCPGTSGRQSCSERPRLRRLLAIGGLAITLTGNSGGWAGNRNEHDLSTRTDIGTAAARRADDRHGDRLRRPADHHDRHAAATSAVVEHHHDNHVADHHVEHDDHHHDHDDHHHHHDHHDDDARHDDDVSSGTTNHEPKPDDRSRSRPHPPAGLSGESAMAGPAPEALTDIPPAARDAVAALIAAPTEPDQGPGVGRHRHRQELGARGDPNGAARSRRSR